MKTKVVVFEAEDGRIWEIPFEKVSKDLLEFFVQQGGEASRDGYAKRFDEGLELTCSEMVWLGWFMGHTHKREKLKDHAKLVCDGELLPFEMAEAEDCYLEDVEKIDIQN